MNKIVVCSLMRKLNLVLGIINNYNFYNVSPFLFSLKRTGYDGDVCFFVGENVSPTTIKKLKEQGVIIMPFVSNPPFLSKVHPENTFDLPNPVHLYNYRHYFYYNYLSEFNEKYENVMLTDIRDVFFQRRPFDFDIGDKINCAVEPKLIKDCKFNSNWMKIGFGEKVFETLADKHIICAGTTWGSTESILEYLKKILGQICLLPDAFNCADQAVHTYMVHTGVIQNVKLNYNDEGVVMTMYHQTQHQLNENNEVVTPSGKVINVLHQYDRHPDLVRILDKKIFSSPLQQFGIKSYQKLMQKLNL